MATYFISDTHFGDKGIIKHERTLFENIDEHDEFIIESINKVVKPTDELWILGDIGNPKPLAHINGRKYLMMGNHDKRPKKEYLGYFAEVYSRPLYISNRVVLSHHPIPVTEGTLNVHGHLHGSTLDSNNHFNISLHMVNYRPVRMDIINNMAGKLNKDNTRFLEEWYADQYLFTTARADVVTDTNGKVKLNESIQLRANLFKEKGE